MTKVFIVIQTDRCTLCVYKNQRTQINGVETSQKRKTTPKTTGKSIKASVPKKVENAMTWCPIIYLSNVVNVLIRKTI